MAKKLYLTFKHEDGSTRSMSFADPKEGLTKDVIDAAAKVFIDTKVFNTEGVITELTKAEYKETVENVIA